MIRLVIVYISKLGLVPETAKTGTIGKAVRLNYLSWLDNISDSSVSGVKFV